MDEDDEAPPGCEEAFSTTVRKAKFQFDSETKSTLIGLEYILEVTSDDDIESICHCFFICVLCGAHCKVTDEVVKHVQLPSHCLLYLEKYFPRAYSLIVKAGPSIESWSSESFVHLESIIRRIESVMGRLQMPSVCRALWDVKGGVVREKIEAGTHLIESPNIVYHDVVPSLFDIIDSSSEAHINQNTSEIATVSEPAVSSDQPEKTKLSSPESPNQEQEDDVLEIVLSDSDCQSSEFGFVNESESPVSPVISKESPNKVSEPRPGSGLQTCDDKRISNQPVDETQKKSVDVGKKSEVSSCARPEEDIVILKDVPVSPVPCKKSSLENYVIESKRQKIRTPPRSSSCDEQFRSRLPSSEENDQLHYRRKSYLRKTSSFQDRPSKFSSTRGFSPPQRRGRDSSPESKRKRRDDGNEPSSRDRQEHPKRCRTETAYRKELEVLIDSLRRKQEIYRKRPEEHPLYAQEWEKYFHQQRSRTRSKKKLSMSDFSSDWFAHWDNIMEELNEEEMHIKKKELKKRYKMIKNQSPVKKKQSDDEEVRTHLKFGWKKSFKTIYSPPKNDKTESSQPSDISQTNANTASVDGHSIDTIKPIPEPAVGPDLLEVLRKLAVLEDCLGSLGPRVTALLSNALSIERSQPGRSSRLLQEDPCCVDLLDTSKEKLKGLLSAGILEGVKIAVATQTIQCVERLLARPPPFNPSPPVPANNSSLATFNLATLVTNLQAVGLIKPDQSVESFILPNEAAGAPGLTDSGPPNFTETVCCDAPYRITTLPRHVPTFSATEPESCTSQTSEFSTEELKTLIYHFRSLTKTQQSDLILYLSSLEEKYCKDNEQILADRKQSSVLNRPQSPLSLRYRQHSFNPSSPDSPPSPLRFPAIFNMTGMSSEDLLTCGLPLDKIDEPCCSTSTTSTSYQNQIETEYERKKLERSNLIRRHRELPALQPQSNQLPGITPISSRYNVVQIVPHQSTSNQTYSMRIDHSKSYCYAELDPRLNRLRSQQASVNSPNLRPRQEYELRPTLIIPISPQF